MSMNIFTITKNINKINKDISKLKDHETEINEKINSIEDQIYHKHEITDIINEVKENLELINEKVNNILDFKINYNNDSVKKEYNVLTNFLKSIDIEDKYINIYIFLKCSEIQDILTTDKDELINLGIPEETIKYINIKTNSFIYNYQNEYV